MRYCLSCHSELQLLRVGCPACGLTYEGRFNLPRLARLDGPHQALVEEIILSAANLKDVAAAIGTSYPTLRKRLEGLIADLRRLRQEDDARCKHLLDAVEEKATRPEEAARLIRELSGGT